METLPAIVRAIVDTMNAWADADLAKIRATHADLKAQVLPRLPLVIPRRPWESQRALRRRDEPGAVAPAPRRHGEGPRAMRQDGDPHPEGWGHERA